MVNPGVPLFSAEVANRGLDFYPAIKRVLNSHWYVLGNEVAEFEREFADYCGTAHCIGVGNGTDALELGLKACGVSAGDKVLLAANAGFYGSAAVLSISAIPVYVDISPEDLMLTPETISESLEQHSPRAIIVTHLYGQLADIENIVQIAQAHDIAVIEDCAQAHGACRNGMRAGSYGSVGCFSFYPTKNLGALGDGGAVVSANDAIADRLRQIRQYGWSDKYQVVMPGGRNSRLDELQAAILRLKLPHLEKWNAQRRDIANHYNRAFKVLPVKQLPLQGEDYVAHLYVLQVENRAKFRDFLGKLNISTDVHYPVPDHMQSVHLERGSNWVLPVTEAACDTVVSLPCFPGLTAEQVEYVIQAVKSYFAPG